MRASSGAAIPELVGRSSREQPIISGRFMCYRLLAVLLADRRQTKPAMQRMQWMSQQLQLTESQKGKITPILIEEAPKAKAVKAESTLTQNEKGAKMLQIRSQTDNKIGPRLNPA